MRFLTQNSGNLDQVDVPGDKVEKDRGLRKRKRMAGGAGPWTEREACGVNGGRVLEVGSNQQGAFVRLVLFRQGGKQRQD